MSQPCKLVSCLEYLRGFLVVQSLLLEQVLKRKINIGMVEICKHN